MYFAVDVQAAIQFSRTHHRHTYTHLLECELVGANEADFIDVDMRENAHKIRESLHGRKPHSERYHDYCVDNDLKGILWRARDGWVELVLFAPFIASNVIIRKATPLPLGGPTTAPTVAGNPS